MNLVKFIRSVEGIYVWILGIGVGCIIACAVAAKIIFTIGGVLNHISISDSGLIMGSIFTSINVVLLILSGIIIFYELSSFVFRLSSSKSRIALFLLGGISVIMIFLFSLYYTPFIMDAQSKGDIASQAFNSMHKQSELVFKILLITLSIQALWRGILLTRK